MGLVSFSLFFFLCSFHVCPHASLLFFLLVFNFCSFHVCPHVSLLFFLSVFDFCSLTFALMSLCSFFFWSLTSLLTSSLLTFALVSLHLVDLWSQGQTISCSFLSQLSPTPPHYALSLFSCRIWFQAPAAGFPWQLGKRHARRGVDLRPARHPVSVHLSRKVSAWDRRQLGRRSHEVFAGKKKEFLLARPRLFGQKNDRMRAQRPFRPGFKLWNDFAPTPMEKASWDFKQISFKVDSGTFPALILVAVQYISFPNCRARCNAFCQDCFTYSITPCWRNTRKIARGTFLI